MLRDPVDIQQDLFLDARINYVGRTSMEVGIRVGQGGESLASCYFTMVARIEENGKVRSLRLKPLNNAMKLRKGGYSQPSTAEKINVSNWTPFSGRPPGRSI